MNAQSWKSQTGLDTMTPTKIAMLTRWENAAVRLPKFRAIDLVGYCVLGNR